MLRVHPARPPFAACCSAAALLAAEALAALTLWTLGGADGLAVDLHDVPQMLRADDTEDLLATAARLVGLALVSWLIVTTLASAARRTIPALRSSSSLDALTLPVVRHLLDRALVLSLGVSALVGQGPAGATTAAGRSVPNPAVTATTTAFPARGPYFSVTPEGDFRISAVTDPGPPGGDATAPSAFGPQPPPEATPSPDSGATADETLVIRAPRATDTPDPDRGSDFAPSSTATPATAGTSTPAATASRSAPAHAATPATGAPARSGRSDGARSMPGAPSQRVNAPRAAVDRYEVQPGDSLWRIAEQRVAAVARGDSDGDVSRYWALLVESNRATLRSGDPSLIYPGEIVLLPALGGGRS